MAVGQASRPKMVRSGEGIRNPEHTSFTHKEVVFGFALNCQTLKTLEQFANI